MDSSISEIEAIGKELSTTLADVLYLLPVSQIYFVYKDINTLPVI